jgi:hydrogenase nickel incorporation protein HypB
MCTTCGCSDDREHGHPHAHAHGHHGHEHTHRHDAPSPAGPTSKGTLVRIERDVLEKNGGIAAENRAWLSARGITALNLVSSPGSGKTTLLERTIRDRGAALGMSVIEGDQATSNDALRIRAAGARAVQVNTGTGCHLDAAMVARALQELEPAPRSVLFVENVGNLVCPALFDLGERAKVLVMSVTEGDDKPEKYPHMFRACELLVLSKVDLLPHVRFDVERCVTLARTVQPKLDVVQLSATRGDGLDAWYDWLGREAAR